MGIGTSRGASFGTSELVLERGDTLTHTHKRYRLFPSCQVRSQYFNPFLSGEEKSVCIAGLTLTYLPRCRSPFQSLLDRPITSSPPHWHHRSHQSCRRSYSSTVRQFAFCIIVIHCQLAVNVIPLSDKPFDPLTGGDDEGIPAILSPRNVESFRLGSQICHYVVFMMIREPLHRSKVQWLLIDSITDVDDC